MQTHTKKVFTTVQQASDDCKNTRLKLLRSLGPKLSLVMEGDVFVRQDASNSTPKAMSDNQGGDASHVLGKADCQRVILHFDVDAFYAQCEVKTRLSTSNSG